MVMSVIVKPASFDSTNTWSVPGVPRLPGPASVPMSPRPIWRGNHRMLDQIAYYAKTFAETAPAIFGIRGTFEQQRYVIKEDLGQGLEIRGYGQSLAAEATVAAPRRE